MTEIERQLEIEKLVKEQDVDIQAQKDGRLPACMQDSMGHTFQIYKPIKEDTDV